MVPVKQGGKMIEIFRFLIEHWKQNINDEIISIEILFMFFYFYH